MQNRLTQTTKLGYAFLLIHLIGWTFATAFIRHNLPLDAIEGAIWGHQLEWGYDKNPFMNAWLTHLAIFIGNKSDWVLYFFSQSSAVICLYTTWLLARRMLTPGQALVSVLLLEGIQYFNFHAIDFNDNTLELGLWGLAIYFFYDATQTNSKSDWLLTGLFAALGVMTKYYTLALLAGMFLFLVTEQATRKQLMTTAPWIGLAIFVIIIFPHCYWLTQHDYITVYYMLERGTGNQVHFNHIYYPAQFAWQQFEVFIPGILLLCLFMTGKRSLDRPASTTHMSETDKRFLAFVGLGPFLLTLLLSCILNIKLRAGWGTPLQSLWGVALVATLQPTISATKSVRAWIITIILMVVMWTGFAISIFYSKDTTTANFPGRDMANLITQEWHKRYHTKLAYIAGSRWAGGNVALYSNDNPAVLINWERARSPWINLAELKRKGAVFIWDMTRNEKLPANIRAAYPQLSKAEIVRFDWKHNHYGLPRGEIGIAFLPPSAST